MLLIIFFLSQFSWSDSPFWRVKDNIHARILEGEIIVSVNSDTQASPKVMTIEGGGMVRAPRSFSFAKAQDYDHFPEMSSYISKARFDQKRQVLLMTLSVLGFRSNMEVHLLPDSDGKQIEFEVIKGPLRGLKGLFRFYDLKANSSEVGISGRLEYEELDIPRPILSFGLEVIFQKLAFQLRRFVETEFAKNRM